MAVAFPTRVVAARDARTGAVLGDRIRVADRMLARLRGLLGRAEPTDDEGLLIVPCTGVHTLGMRYPIDVVFMDRDGRIVRTCDALKPMRAIPWVRHAYVALELRAGSVARAGVRTGDLLLFEPGVDETLGAARRETSRTAAIPPTTAPRAPAPAPAPPAAVAAARTRQPAGAPRGAARLRALASAERTAGQRVLLGAVVGLLAGLVVAWLLVELRAPLLAVPLAIAVVTDLRSRRIPNWLTLGGTAFALASALDSVLVLAALGALAAGGIGLLLAIAARGGFGMGDVKLLAYAGAAVTLPSVPDLLLAMSLAGGALAIALIVERGMRRGMTMPFGPAIAAGCAWALVVH